MTSVCAVARLAQRGSYKTKPDIPFPERIMRAATTRATQPGFAVAPSKGLVSFQEPGSYQSKC